MVSRYAKLRVKRSLRYKQKALERAGVDANKQFEYHVVRRWRNLRGVQRFVAGWLFLVTLLASGVYLQTQNLSAFYQSDQPEPGGTYREGIVGEFGNLNPIYASTNIDKAASKLIFSNLFKYNSSGEIVGDAAASWKVNKDGTIYTVKLRDNIKWHDGVRLTAEDVVFTYQTIQNPDVRSPLGPSWKDIRIEAQSELTVTFTLPNSFAPFLHSLTRGGILPKHVLSTTNPEQMRSSEFNSIAPIGSGPFKYSEVAEVGSNKELRLRQFEEYYLGVPNITQINLIAYADQEAMVKDFNDGELAAIGGLKGVDMSVINNDINHTWNDVPLENGVYAFLRNGDDKLSDAKMRTALVRATNQVEILKSLNGRFISVDSALLKGQIGYNQDIIQHKYDPAKAKKALDDLGWKKGDDGWRYKDNQKLTLVLTTQDSDYYPKVADQLKAQWAQVGINLEVQLVDEAAIQSNHIIPHNYQVFLTGIEIGHDPDVYPFWHSSQASIGGFNLAEYKSDQADIALEAGRTRSDEELRDLKYKPFIEAWAQDAPAIGIYQPTYVYIQQARAKGFEPNAIASPEERYNNIHKWFINSKVKTIPY